MGSSYQKLKRICVNYKKHLKLIVELSPAVNDQDALILFYRAVNIALDALHTADEITLEDDASL